MGSRIRSKFPVVIDTIVIHKKWKNTTLSQELKCKFKNVVNQYLGSFDFCLNGERLIIYIPESSLVTCIEPERYLEIAENDTTVIIAVRNTITAEHYSHLQDVLVINNNKKLIPVGDASEVPDLLQQMALVESTEKKSSKFQCSLNHSNILLNIPGLGIQKAEKLLNTFGTVNRIASCSVSELSNSLGLSLGAEVHKYFH